MIKKYNAKENKGKIRCTGNKKWLTSVRDQFYLGIFHTWWHLNFGDMKKRICDLVTFLHSLSSDNEIIEPWIMELFWIVWLPSTTDESWVVETHKWPTKRRPGILMPFGYTLNTAGIMNVETRNYEIDHWNGSSFDEYFEVGTILKTWIFVRY